MTATSASTLLEVHGCDDLLHQRVGRTTSSMATPLSAVSAGGMSRRWRMMGVSGRAYFPAYLRASA